MGKMYFVHQKRGSGKILIMAYSPFRGILIVDLIDSGQMIKIMVSKKGVV